MISSYFSNKPAHMTSLMTRPNPQLLIEYIDEDFEVWGSEVWDASKGRLGGNQFVETDFDDKLKGEG
jgi:hypothetical protein